MVLYAGVFLGMSIGFGAIFEWTLHGERVYQPLPPERHWAARARFVGGGLVYVLAIVVALFNAVASFVLIALGRRVLHRGEHPGLRRPGRSGDDEQPWPEEASPRLIVAIKQVSGARLG